MKNQIIKIFLAGVIALATTSCQDSSKTSAGGDAEKETKSDSTYMESQDNNGQPTSDEDGGTVTETKGAPESGYGNANGTESQPSSTGSSGSAAGTGDDDKK